MLYIKINFILGKEMRGTVDRWFLVKIKISKELLTNSPEVGYCVLLLGWSEGRFEVGYMGCVWHVIYRQYKFGISLFSVAL